MRFPLLLGINVVLAGSAMLSPRSHAEPCPDNQLPEDPLRLAIEDLTATFGIATRTVRSIWRGWTGSRSELAAGDRRPGGSADTPNWKQLRREALLANPLVSGQPLLFVVRHQYRPDHHNTETMFQTGEINTGSFQGPGALKTHRPGPRRRGRRRCWNCRRASCATRTSASTAKKILFSMRRNRQDDYHLYEMHADGSGLEAADLRLRHLGHRPDLPAQRPDPVHLDARAEVLHVQPAHHGQPVHDGRRRRQPPADRPQHAARRPRRAAARRPDALRPLGIRRSQLRRRPGRVDRATPTARTTRSTGRTTPTRRARCSTPGPIPGTELFMATFSSCHDRPWGALAIVDRRLGLDGRPPVRPHLAGRRDRPGRPRQLRHLHAGPAQVRRPVSAVRQVLPLLADDRAGRADGDLPAGRVRQRDPGARRRAGLLRPAAAGARALARR